MRYHSGSGGALARRAETLSAECNELAACLLALTRLVTTPPPQEPAAQQPGRIRG